MSNEKDRVYDLTITLEVKVVGTSEELAIDHALQVLNDTCKNNSECFGAIEVTDWNVE